MNSKDYFLHDSLCPLPWIGVYINPDGSIKNCAISTTVLGNIHKTAIENALSGPTNVEVKTDMLNHVRHARCNACYKVEDISNHNVQTLSASNRGWYKKYGIKNLDLYNDPHNFDLKILDLRWRNTCNQACVYCGPDLSSKWADELNNTDYHISEDTLKQNKKYILDRVNSVNHVYLAGGEPLLIVENLELLEALSVHNPMVEIRINTNLSVVNNKIFKKLLTFKNVKWTVSVDAAFEEYNYIRYPGNWNTFYNNLIDLKNRDFDINFNMVWCVLNADSIFNCIEYLESAGFHENTFIIQCLNHPSSLNVQKLPDSELSKLRVKIKNKLIQTNPDYWLHKSLETMYNYIDTPSTGNLEETFDFLKTLDTRRKLDSKIVFPSLYNL